MFVLKDKLAPHSPGILADESAFHGSFLAFLASLGTLSGVLFDYSFKILENHFTFPRIRM